MTKTSRREFWQMCANHDWRYHYSDDPRYYRAGKESAKKIHDILDQQPELRRLYEDFYAWAFDGAPKPDPE